MPQLPAANDFVMAAADTFARTYCNVYEPPIEVHLAHRRPAYGPVYDGLFRTVVRFGAPCNAFVLPRARLNAPLNRTDLAARAEYEKHAEEWLSRIRNSSGVAAAVRRMLLQNLHTGGGTMAITARRLAMSIATLRRRLEDEGLTFAEVELTWPDALAAWLASTAVAPPGGESFDEVSRRVRRSRDQVLETWPGRTVLVVSHVTPIKTFVRLALDAPGSALYRMELAPASLTTVAWFSDGNASLRSFNEVGHLDSLSPAHLERFV